MVVLAVLWVLLLVASSALADQAWFLIAVGGIGMLQSIFVAGWSRDPKVLGLPVKFDGVTGFPRVIDTVYAVEERLPKAGRCLSRVFFPGGIRDKEEKELYVIETEVKMYKGHEKG